MKALVLVCLFVFSLFRAQETYASPSVNLIQCGSITESGTYLLQANISFSPTTPLASCISILAPNVTIDGRGYRIIYSGSAADSICISSTQANTVITNVSFSACPTSIYLEGPSPIVSTNAISGGVTGIALWYADYATISGNSITGLSAVGISATGGFGVSITSNTVSQLQGSQNGIGISVSMSSNANIVSNTMQNVNGGSGTSTTPAGGAFGILIEQVDSGNVRGNTVAYADGGDGGSNNRWNGGDAYGIYAVNSSCKFVENSIWGIYSGDGGVSTTATNGGQAAGIALVSCYLSSTSLNSISGPMGGAGQSGTGGAAYGIYANSGKCVQVGNLDSIAAGLGGPGSPFGPTATIFVANMTCQVEFAIDVAPEVGKEVAAFVTVTALLGNKIAPNFGIVSFSSNDVSAFLPSAQSLPNGMISFNTSFSVAGVVSIVVQGNGTTTTKNVTVLQDVNECADGTAECTSGSSCSNILGSYLCVASPQFAVLSNTSVSIFWQVPSSGYTNTLLEMSENGNNWQIIYNGNLSRFNQSGLTPSKNYFFRLSHYNPEIGPTAYAPIVSITTSDVDECALGEDNCSEQATCTNTIGGFTCTCNSGYSGNGVICTDVDECELYEDICSEQATCTNTIGGFACVCNSGYSGTGVICTDIDECEENTDLCANEASCHNTVGAYNCSCNTGYQGTGFSCSDVNECLEETDNCNTNARCENTVGSFNCFCNSGYSGNGITCEDIDECETETDNCAADASCTNTQGSFYCTCVNGSNGNGVVCDDIDECETETDNCAADASCTNTQGSFYCTCNSGFHGNGVVCEDINECEAETDNCAADASCANTQGSFYCTCNSGFHGNGVVCEDINECETETDNCAADASCTNTQGSFYCTCNNGFHGSGIVCEDVDECESQTHNCDLHATCTNTVGSFLCSCNNGWSGDGVSCLGRVPSQIALISLTQYGRDFLTIAWHPGDDGGAPTKYSIFYSSNLVWKNISVDSNVTSYKLTHLDLNTTYSIYIIAANLVGESQVSVFANFTTASAYCGDGICDSIESCSSCYFDCSELCETPTCPGTPMCNGRGTCVSGTCQCNIGAAGPECSLNKTVSINVTLVPHPTQPTFSIVPAIESNNESAPAPQTNFLVNINSIREVDTYGSTVTKFSSFNVTQVDSVQNSTVIESTFTFKLPNSAILILTSQLFPHSQDITFAGQKINIPENGFKLSLEVKNWPFAQIRNTLEISMGAESGNTNNSAYIDENMERNDGNNLEWVKLRAQGTTLFATYLDDAIIDGEIKKVAYSLNEEKLKYEVAISIPHFWESVVIDPSYAVLVEPANEENQTHGSSGSVSTVVIIAVVAVVVGLSVLVTIVILIFKEKQRVMFDKELKERHSRLYKTDSSSSMSF